MATKSLLIDQAVRGYFGIQASRFAGHENASPEAEQDYFTAIKKLQIQHGMTMSEIGSALRDAYKVSFYTQFAREVLGDLAIEVAA